MNQMWTKEEIVHTFRYIKLIQRVLYQLVKELDLGDPTANFASKYQTVTGSKSLECKK